MKSPLVIAAVAVLVGFFLGWTIKPTPSPEAKVQVESPPPAAARPARSAAELPVPERDRRPQRDPAAGPFVPRDGVGPVLFAPAREMRERAKMLRLVEALGLTEQQQDQLRQLIAEAGESLTAAADPQRFPDATRQLAALEKAGGILAGGLATILTESQREEFEAMLHRERQNQVEAVAQRELAEVLDRVDLTEEQRAAAAERLRQAAAAKAGEVPLEHGLMLGSSILPLGAHGVSRQSLEVLSGLQTGGGDAAAEHREFLERQRRELDDRLQRLRGILTPAQLAGYEAALEEQRIMLDRMSEHR